MSFNVYFVLVIYLHILLQLLPVQFFQTALVFIAEQLDFEGDIEATASGKVLQYLLDPAPG